MTWACSHERWAFLQALNPPPCPPESCPLQIRPPIKLRACHAGYHSNCVLRSRHTGRDSTTRGDFLVFVGKFKLGSNLSVSENRKFAPRCRITSSVSGPLRPTQTERDSTTRREFSVFKNK